MNGILGLNEFGTPVTIITCQACGREFTVCPALEKPPEECGWENCLAVDCPSYDPSRDIDALWDAHADLGLIVTESVEQT